MIFHETGKNTKDTPRLSISGDILLTMKEGVKSEHNLPSPSTWMKTIKWCKNNTMPLTNVNIRPGINKADTPSGAEGQWIGGDFC